MAITYSIEREDEFINQEYQRLINACMPKTEENLKLIKKAFELSRDAHQGIRRKSGEPYILHPLAVAQIAAEEIGLGTKGIVAALLHDVVEDTEYTVEDLETIFNKNIASIVDGLTKLSDVYDKTKSSQAENFRKLLLTMAEDVRVILIKLADRLHNMRTLGSMPDHKRLKIAGETLFIFAPLAHRLGLYAIKTELEDLSLKYEHPKIYQEIESKIEKSLPKNQELVNQFIRPIQEKLSADNYHFKVIGRPKSIYSIWSKMHKNNVPFEEIYDILAIRIVFEPKEGIPEKTQCYTIYSLLTDTYKPKPERLRDWVSTPKANGYEALHSTLMGSSGKWVEVQILSSRMEEIAERGFAVQWKYKSSSDTESELDNWLKRIRELLQNPDPDSLEFLDDFKLNLFASEMMIFTPKGDVKVLPKGATALDLAFEIHTTLGYKCIGAKVNHRLVPISHQLKSGDQVEILTSDKQKPKFDWIEFAFTAKAKSRLKEVFKKERREILSKGEHVLEEALKIKKLTINSKILKKIIDHFNLPNKEELYFRLGKEAISIDNLSKILTAKTSNKWIKYWQVSMGKGSKKEKLQNEAPKQKQLIITDDVDKEKYIIAQCCNPIPGDDVVGYIDDDNKFILHNRKCSIALKLMSSQGNKIVSAQWESHKILSFLAVINMSGIDQIGIVSRITKIISEDQNVNMRSINFESHDGIFEGKIFLYIHSTEDLNNLIYRLVKVKGVHNVKRQEQIN